MNDKLISHMADLMEDETIAMVKELVANRNESHGHPR